jgi:hypothetical protein
LNMDCGIEGMPPDGPCARAGIGLIIATATTAAKMARMQGNSARWVKVRFSKLIKCRRGSGFAERENRLDGKGLADGTARTKMVVRTSRGRCAKAA